jgi:hypothetical protein
VLTGPFSPLFGPFFRAKRAGPARLGPLRAGLGQKSKPAGSAGPARFWPGRPVWPSLAVGLVLIDRCGCCYNRYRHKYFVCASSWIKTYPLQPWRGKDKALSNRTPGSTCHDCNTGRLVRLVAAVDAAPPPPLACGA